MEGAMIGVRKTSSFWRRALFPATTMALALAIVAAACSISSAYGIPNQSAPSGQPETAKAIYYNESQYFDYSILFAPDNPYKIYLDEAVSDPNLVGQLTLWQLENFNIAGAITGDDVLSHQGFYETVIFDLLYESVLDDTLIDSVDATAKMFAPDVWRSLTAVLEADSEDFDLNVSLTDEQKAAIGPSLYSVCGGDSLFGAFDKCQAILSTCRTAEDVIDRFSMLMAVQSTSEYTVHVLSAMSDNCGDNDLLRNALNRMVAYCEGSMAVPIILAVDVTDYTAEKLLKADD